MSWKGRCRPFNSSSMYACMHCPRNKFSSVVLRGVVVGKHFFPVFFAYSMLPRQQLRVSPLPGAGNGERDAAGWKVGRWWWRWRWRRWSGCLSCPVDEWTGRDFREPWEFSPRSWMMLQGPDVIFIGLLGRRMLGIVLTCADPCCAVLCRAVASWIILSRMRKLRRSPWETSTWKCAGRAMSTHYQRIT